MNKRDECVSDSEIDKFEGGQFYLTSKNLTDQLFVIFPARINYF